MLDKANLVATYHTFLQVVTEKLPQLRATDLPVSSSGALVMVNKKKTAEDIDIEVTPQLFQVLKEAFPDLYAPKPLFPGHPLGEGMNERLSWNNSVEVMINTAPLPLVTETTAGVCHRTLRSTIDFKLWLGRQKDFAHLREAMSL